MIRQLTPQQRRTIGVLALAGYVACVPLANWFIGHVGTQPAPGAPHVITVWPGIVAPSGVLLVGVALCLRDAAQATLGRFPILLGMAAGTVLSYALADPLIATASLVAFAFSEGSDFLVYDRVMHGGKRKPAQLQRHARGRWEVIATGDPDKLAKFEDFEAPRYSPVRYRIVTSTTSWRVIAAVAFSGATGLVADSIIFLWIAFGTAGLQDFFWGQVIGKTYAVLASCALIWIWRRTTGQVIPAALAGVE